MQQHSQTHDVQFTDLTGFQRDLLVVIAELKEEAETAYGLGIKERLEQQLDADVNHGRLYPNLDELVSLGLVSKGTVDKRTNKYGLTDRGMALLRSRRARLDDVLD